MWPLSGSSQPDADSENMLNVPLSIDPILYSYIMYITEFGMMSGDMIMIC